MENNRAFTRVTTAPYTKPFYVQFGKQPEPLNLRSFVYGLDDAIENAFHEQNKKGKTHFRKMPLDVYKHYVVDCRKASAILTFKNYSFTLRIKASLERIALVLNLIAPPQNESKIIT